jgi:hypothetical protein
MVGIVLYASMTSVMASRRIEQLLATDAGFRVVAANQRPDHVTICRFLTRHRDALADVFAQVVGLAAEAGLVDPTLVAVDGTKMAANASKARNERLGDLRERFADWADTVEDNDRADDENEPPGPVPEMADRASMRDWITHRLAQRADDSDDRRMNVTDPDSGLLPRTGGGWVQGYNAQAGAVPGGIVVAGDVVGHPNDALMLAPMVGHISDAVGAATGESVGVVVGDAGYWSSAAIEAIQADDTLPDVLIATGRRQPDEAPEPLTDPALAEHNAARAVYDQAVAAEQARRIPVIERLVNGELIAREAAALLDISTPRAHELKHEWITAGGAHGLAPPRPGGRQRPKTPTGPTRSMQARHAMDTRLASPAGRSFYRQRQATIEPVFGDLKTNRRINRFLRRGLDAVRSEWHLMLTGHNLTILHANTT